MSFSAIWSVVDEIFLVGIVFSHLFVHHSMSPRHSVLPKADRPEGYNIWEHVHEPLYSRAVERYYRLTGQKLSKRSGAALKKRWKLMGGQQNVQFQGCDGSCDSHCTSKTKHLQKLWENQYNVEGRLTCSEEQYAALLDKADSLFGDLWNEN